MEASHLIMAKSLAIISILPMNYKPTYTLLIPIIRGTNENTNGLIRHLFDKEMRLDNLDHTDVQRVEELLNNRPRKVLGYLTPFEVMASTTIFALHT